MRNCPHKQKKDSGKRQVQKESLALLADCTSTEMRANFYMNVLSGMMNDNILGIIKSDDIITSYGVSEYEMLGDAQADTIRQNMRGLGRLVAELRHQATSDQCSLRDCLQPEKFDTLIGGILSLVRSDHNEHGRPQLGIPSLALKLGYSLKKCAGIMLGKSIKSGDQAGERKAEAFLKLYDLEWNKRISKCALATLSQRKTNAPQLLPLTQDLVTLQSYQLRTMNELGQQLNSCPSAEIWMKLAKVALSRLIVFNKRRGGEAACMHLSSYISRPNWRAPSTEEFKANLSGIERKLCDRLLLVEIIGKRGRKVPVLITPELQSSIDLLVKYRSAAGIHPENPYMFARAFRNSTRYVRGNDCLREVCNSAGLQQPELVTSTRLRKYIATVAQIVNMSENECDWLANHLGHDYRVHKKFYRLNDSVMELAKVSKLLISADRGHIHKYAGKFLDDIDVAGEHLHYLMQMLH